MRGVSESATLRLNALVAEMKKQGQEIFNFTAGEPDFFVPEAAKQAVREALTANASKYTPVAGIPELRAQVAEKTNRAQPKLVKRWSAQDVVITNGGKQAIFNTFLALLKPGERVLIPAPYWLSYPSMVQLCGGVPVIIPTDPAHGYKLQPEQLRQALLAQQHAPANGRSVKMLILNSPNNPTGAVYSAQEFQALVQVLESQPFVELGRKLWVLSDEIYDRIVFPPAVFCSFLAAAPQWREQTITINGMSKSAAMTGWRIGWSVAPQRLTESLVILQGQSTSGINSLAQWASVAALKLPEESFQGQKDSYLERRNQMVGYLAGLSGGGTRVVIPEGAFYLFLDIKAYLAPQETASDLAEKLLTQCGVAVVPGGIFGAPDSIRLSFATNEATLKGGCLRLVDFLKKSAT